MQRDNHGAGVFSSGLSTWDIRLGPAFSRCVRCEKCSEEEVQDHPREEESVSDEYDPLYDDPRLDVDMVNRPPHYTLGAVEAIDAIESALDPTEFSGYCKGNAMKYIWRSGLKSYDWREDIEKAVWYLNRLLGKKPGEYDEEELKRLGWRRCAVGQETTQYCAEAQRIIEDLEG